jgi:ribosome-associated toxin RatA of RatAB toxin-antitoxin module
MLLAGASPVAAAVPSLRAMGMNPAALASILGDSQMVLLHHPRDFRWDESGKSKTKKASFISSMKVVQAPPETVRSVVYDVGKYPEFIAEISEVAVQDKGDERIAEFETELNMLVLTAGVDYTLAYRNEPNGDITWRLVEGDLEAHVGRWEFFELPGGKTLVAFTHWQDLASGGIKISAVLRAQPDMRLVLPVTWAAVVMESMYKRAEGLPRDSVMPTHIIQSEPQIPMLSTGGVQIPVTALRRLAEAGTILLIHPRQWFMAKKGKPTDFLFMGAAAIADMPAEAAQKAATNFPRFPEFLDQIDEIKRAQDVGGKRRYDFKLKVGISIFTIPVKYQLEYTDVTPLAISYKRASGELEHIYGAWEFFNIGDNKTLVMYTTGNKMGENAPSLLKVGQDVPNRDLIVGVSATALTIQKLIPWLDQQGDKQAKAKE